MSSKQLKKLILIVVSLVIVIGGAFALLFFFDTDSGGEDDEAAKIAGGYETMKSDLVSTLKIRDSQAATIANIFFDDQDVHAGPASEVVPSARVPYKEGDM